LKCNKPCAGWISAQRIAKAKAAGIYKGGSASIDVARVREMKAQGLGATAIAKALGIGRASVYRVLEGCCCGHRTEVNVA
jgi:DNA invertase Pin-like site-specific DNA recombinase